MDEPTLVVLNEIESAPNDALLILKGTDEVERFKAKLKATNKKSIVESIEVPVTETYMEKHMNKNCISNWKEIAKEGEELFEYLLSKYEIMLDGDDKVKHFDIGSEWGMLTDKADEFKETYSDDIQRELVPWIRDEIHKGGLFKLENWRPFRDHYTLFDMFLGYRKLFQYKEYLFQLSLLSACENDISICKYCEKGDYGRHFGVVLYGWRDVNRVKLQPVDFITVLDDNIIPESYWCIKR